VRRSRGSPRRWRALRRRLTDLLRGRERAVVLTRAEELLVAGMPASDATACAALVYGYGLLDVVELIEIAEHDREPREPDEVAQLYYALSEHLGVDAALTSVSMLERGDRWHALARLALRDDLYASLRAITLDALREAPPGTAVDAAIELRERVNTSRLVRARAALHEVGTAQRLDLATLSVVTKQLRGLARCVGCGSGGRAGRRTGGRRVLGGCRVWAATSRRCRCVGPIRTCTATSTTPAP